MEGWHYRSSCSRACVSDIFTLMRTSAWIAEAELLFRGAVSQDVEVQWCKFPRGRSDPL